MSSDRKVLRRSVLLVSAAFAAAACEAGERIETMAVRDSLGIAIMENRRSSWGQAGGWKVSAEPVLRIGAREGDPRYELHHVRDVLRLEDGRIVVANSGTREIRFYGPNGEFVGSGGREGSGPGEFQRIASVYSIRGDSLLAYDDVLQRKSVFDSDGKFARTFRLEPVAYELAWPEAYLEGGSLLVGSGVPMGTRATTGVERSRVLLLRFDLEGRPIDSLGYFPGAERYVQVTGNLRTTIGGPFRRISRFVGGSGKFWVGTGDSFELAAYSLEGEPDRIVRLDRPNRLVTPADVQRYLAVRLEGLDPQASPSVRRAIEESPFPESMPAYSDIHRDEQGHLWVSEYLAPGEEGPASWFIFAPVGKFLGTLELPRRLTIHQVGSDFILGAYRNEFGAEEVHLYDLDREGAWVGSAPSESGLVGPRAPTADS